MRLTSSGDSVMPLLSVISMLFYLYVYDLHKLDQETGKAGRAGIGRILGERKAEERGSKEAGASKRVSYCVCV